MRKSILLFCSFFISICCLAQWTDDYGTNTLVSNTTTSDIISVGTQDGKTYVVYWDEPAGYVLKAQLLDADGNQLFGENGLVVNTVADMSTWTATRSQAVDNEGNIYISFTATGNSHGYANKISPAGDQMWGAGGIDLGENAFDTKILPTEDGGAIIGWYADGKGNLMRYDADGNELWSTVKILDSPDSSNPFTSVGELALLSDGSFIVFMHVKGTSWTINSMLWAQRYAADGTAIWTSPVQVSDQTTAFNRRYEVLQDGDVTYLGYYGSTGFRFDSFLQRINSDGTLPWGINGSDFRTDDTYYEMTTSIAFEEGSDYIWSIAWVSNDTQNLYGEYIQKFDKTTGERMLTDNAKEIFPINADAYVHNGNLQLVNNQPFFLGSTGIGDGVNPLQLFVAYLDENGNFAWDENYIEIATTATAKSRVDFTKNVDGQSVAVWTEDRGASSKAYAQNYKIEAETEDGCLTVADTTFPQWPIETVTPACDGTPEALTDGVAYTGEYSMIQVTAGTEYIFSSSIASYFITIGNEDGDTVLASGTGSVTWTSDTDQLVRFYTHLDSDCNASDDIHDRIIQCGDFVEPTDYCEPESDCGDGDLITNVTFQEINNDSDCGPNGYNDYTSMMATVEAGETYQMSVTVGSGWTYESVMVWIDFNNNFVFEPSEYYFIGSDPGTVNVGDIMIPEGAAEGQYRMRVRVGAVNPDPTLNDLATLACDEETIQFGETEDYTLIIGEVPPTGGDCEQVFAGDPNTGVGFINNGTDIYIAANDINVEANTQFTVATISLDVVSLGGEPTMFDLSFYTDNAGVDEQIGSTQSGLIPSSITPNGTFGSTGYPVYTVELSLATPQLLQATATEPAKYWIAISGYPSVESANVYWVSYLYTENPDSEPSWQSPDGGFAWAEFANSNGEAVEGIMTVTGECATLGVSDMTSFDFAYYPNPVKDVLNITTKKAVESVSVFNLAGQQVMNNAKVSNGQINVNALSTGTYVFRVTLDGGQVETFKIIKK